MGDINPNHHAVEPGEGLCHVNNAKIPAAVTGYEQYNMRGMVARLKDVQGSKWTISVGGFLDGICAGYARPKKHGHSQAQGASDHFLNTPMKPPEIMLVTARSAGAT